MAPLIRQVLAVARKDFRSELRTRYALNSLGMFIVVTVAVIAFSVGTERIGSGIASAMIWVSMFFTAVTGLGRTFISEEERGTSLLLRLTVPATPVYFGKLLVNIVLALVSNLILSLLFIIMMGGIGGAEVKSPGAFMLVVALSSLGFAGALTIIAALIARSGSKGALYPVISFPVILPLVVLGVDLLRRSMAGVSISMMSDDLLLLGLYTAALMLVSFFLFDLIWKE
jgi:heme exporter protein B